VVLAGASGLIGTALRESLLRSGHDVARLVRRAPAAVDEKQWDPDRHHVQVGTLAGADVVVCLSGAGVGDRRRTSAYKKTLIRSRTGPVSTLARALADGAGPRVLVCASAVGYYGDTGDAEVDETAPAGTGFLAELCQEWEGAAQPARDAGIRVAQLRTGIVLSRHSPLLERLVPIVRLGLAGRTSTGRQFLPWITLADEVAAISHVMAHDIAGPVNLTAPQPARNAQFMKTLARLLHRRALIPTPAFALRLAIGELAEDALGGQRALPAVLARTGFEHRHTELREALAWALTH
jgi:hypothetical protein